jgi:Ca-activated chloride channel family protein
MRESWFRVSASLVFAAAALALGACRSSPAPATSAPVEAAVPPSAPSSASSSEARAPATPVELDVVFSSEKKDWAGEAIAQFNASGAKTDDGRSILVKATFSGSVEPIDGIVAAAIKPSVFSPASSLVLPLLADAWAGAHGVEAKPIVGHADSLVLSPVVIAMWEPMARALGWPARKLGWRDIAALSRAQGGWRSKGHPEWGDFRFGHTHPEYSNSGLIAVLGEASAATGKTRDLAPADFSDPRTKAFLHDVESSVVHYGRSTGFFYDALAEHGPSYLSAAVLYENLVVASAKRTGLAFPLVCVYPAEGTAWADHPYAVLDAPWVGAPERDAAQKLEAYLLSRPVQERAMTGFGFRPALTDIPLGAPIDAEHGADPKEPQTLLAAPNVRTLRAMLEAWSETKRGVDIVVVFDRSGSMNGLPLQGARDGLVAFLRRLRQDDLVSLITFNGHLDPPTAPTAPVAVIPRAQAIFADGETALYDAILAGRDLALTSAATDKKHIHAVVVLTDGEDNRSHLTLAQLLEKLKSAEATDAVRVFTIGYGTGASEPALRRIAAQTGGAYYHGDVANIRSVYEEIASFF